jgi:outer membrane protein
MSRSKFPKFCASTAVVLAGLVTSQACRAEDDKNPPTYSTPVKDEGVSVGPAISDADPGYVGDHHQLTVYPWFTYRNEHFFVYGLGTGYELATGQRYILSVMAVPQIQRRSSSGSPQLSGLKYRPWSIDGGVNLAMWSNFGGMALGVFHDILGRNNGMTVRFGYFLPIPVGSGEISPSIGATWENSNLTNYYYGIDPSEARPGRPAYSPASAANPTAQLKYERPFGDQWRFSAELSYMRFGRAIRLSPIVDESSTRSIQVTLLYSFGQSSSSTPD